MLQVLDRYRCMLEDTPLCTQRLSSRNDVQDVEYRRRQAGVVKEEAQLMQMWHTAYLENWPRRWTLASRRRTSLVWLQRALAM
jgi:hypothetical protein